MSVMSVESPEQGTPSRVLSAQSTRAHHSPNLDNEPEMANDSKYHKGGGSLVINDVIGACHHL